MLVYFYFVFIFVIYFDKGESKQQKLFDLTYNFDNDTTVYWPTARQWRFRLMDAGSSGSYEAYRFCTAEHGGTHMDSPRHFVKGTHGVQEIPLDRLVGRAFIVDVSEEAKNNTDLLITKKYFLEAEKSQKTKVDDKIVLLYTGFSKHYPNLDLYLGTSTTNASKLHFPGLCPTASEWLVKERKIKSIGIDTASIDYGQSKTYQSHVNLFTANIPAFENVNLKDIKKFQSSKTMIYALPMKIKDGSGAPLRIIAQIEDEDCPSRSPINAPSRSMTVILVLFCIMFINQVL